MYRTRPAFFQSRRVARCVDASTRLCTCIRSMRSTRSFLIESSIWRIPACLPLVQTLVATKSFDCTPSSAASCPVTASEEPYIGELSMTRPPFSTKTLSVSLARASSFASPATSNTCQVPRPTAGISSPVLGMRRASGTAAAFDPEGMSRTPKAVALTRMKLRRAGFMFISREIVGNYEDPHKCDLFRAPLARWAPRNAAWRLTIRQREERDAEAPGKTKLRRRPADHERAVQPVRAPRRPDFRLGPAPVRRGVLQRGTRSAGAGASDPAFSESALRRAGAPRDEQHEEAARGGRLEHGLPAESDRVAEGSGAVRGVRPHLPHVFHEPRDAARANPDSGRAHAHGLRARSRGDRLSSQEKGRKEGGETSKGCAPQKIRAPCGALDRSAADFRQAGLRPASTLAGTKGTERRRTPIASNTAFEIAAGTTAAVGSPAPQGRSFGRSISSIATSGTSGKVRIG